MTTIMSLTAEEQRKLAFECGAKEVDEYGWDDEIAFSNDAMTAYTAAVEAKERERIEEWIRSQRNDVPATGEEFANAIRSLK